MSRQPLKKSLASPAMQLAELELSLVSIPQAEGSEAVRSLVVRLITDDGLEGWGEAPTGWRSDELNSRAAVLRAVILGRNAFDIEELLTLDVLQNAQVRCAVEMAAWDLVGRRANMPLCHLFGGCYRRRVPLAIRLHARHPRQAAKLSAELAQQGFHAHVVTATGRPETDLTMLRAVREAVGDRAQLRLDGAERFDMETARDLCAELEFDAIEFLLDPLNTRQLHAAAALGRQTTVPLALSRAITRPGEVLAAVRSGAARFVVLRLPELGGLLTTQKSASVAAAAGLKTLACTGPSLGIATAAMLQLAAALPVLDGCNECAYPQLHDDVLTERLELVDGMLTVPQSPGLGVTVDRGKLEQYQVT
ncbi:MAG: mandelate racemase/muconate lactonizing enzyme family protein [Thermoguttaceae bacterium]|nr:mandelate racemase/muconate lactonizing enzyme family protein [Thermoguttaceae bacterium]